MRKNTKKAYFSRQAIRTITAWYLLQAPDCLVIIRSQIRGSRAYQLFSDHTINVAKERRIEDEYGSIEVGKSADFVIWNVDRLTEVLYDIAVGQDITPTDHSLVYADEVYFKGEPVFIYGE